MSFCHQASLARRPRSSLFRRIVLGIALLGLTVSVAHASWAGIREGIDVKEVTEQVGAPLILCVTRSGAWQTWSYDRGGYILIENGKVRFWQMPRAERP